MEEYCHQFDQQLDTLNKMVDEKLATLEAKVSELSQLKKVNEELNKELSQVIRQNEFLSAVIADTQKQHFTQSDHFQISSFNGCVRMNFFTCDDITHSCIIIIII